ncbi:carbohydrate-binding module family 13 protein [Rhizophagus clarus]|uniref:Carbohydrate-binding module family 13 protein n=1 Tax=Rhizophagus clarus TaxID=94130 RepID=A0A8H3KUU4_9GLOM|nr:carbohydrate-binding module family 13 protein [Rhizophagus clarus]
MDDNKLLPRLSQNLLEILNDDQYYDVTIEVGNDPYKNDGTLSHIKLPNILPEIFQIILRYIYGGKLFLKEYDASDIVKVLVAANELRLQELMTYLQFYLIENKASWMEKNFDFIYQTSFKNDSFMELQKYCTDIMTKEPDRIFNSPTFSSISEKLLIKIIQSDNLQMSEIQIWEHVLKWGLSHNPELSPDIINYSKDNFKILKNTLQQFIPFIRFYNLTSKEFLDKVFPYREILPEELCTDLLKTFLGLSDPNSKPINKSKPRILEEIKLRTIDSKIITYQHVEIILKWVDRLEITDKLTSSYEFKLLFRGTRDGLTRDKFHQICDNHSRTVTIIKVKDSNEILGGYNPVEWKSDSSFGITKDSFIFSFNGRVENYILSRVVDQNHAIGNSPNSGPNFGGRDIFILGSLIGNVCEKLNYEKPIRKTKNQFFIEEYEIFLII